MGRQRGCVHISGQFDDMQFSLDGKRGNVKLSVPIDKSRIDKDPEFAGTRKANAEFKGAALGASAVQECLGGKSFTFGDRYFRSRLQGQLTAMLKAGPGREGERMLEVVATAEKLRLVHLDDGERFGSRFRGSYDLTVNPDRNTATFVVGQFEVEDKIGVPQGATDFRLFLCAGVVSDYTYVGGRTVYEPVNAAINKLHNLVYTPLMPVSGTNTGFQIVAAVPTLPILPSSAGLVVSVGIQFYKVVNGYPSIKAEGNAMQIHGLF